MGMHIDIVNYDSGNYESVKSDRTYIKHEITSTVQEYEGGYYGPLVETSITRFYEDEETGILTRDVGKYEAWLKTLVTR